MIDYFTGLRFGDCCTLKWREVDLLRRVIERVPRKTQNTRKDRAAAMVKVGIPAFLFELLSKAPLIDSEYVLPEYAAIYLKRDAIANLRVTRHFNKCGIQTQRTGTGIKTLIDPKTGEPKINPKTGKPMRAGTRAVVEIGFHSLRYSYISHNAEAGTPLAIIQKNAGHANPAMTEHYTRISDKAAVEYAAALQLPAFGVEAVTVADNETESERLELIERVKRLPIETIRQLSELLK